MKFRVALTTSLTVLGTWVAGSAAQDTVDIRPRSDLRGHRGAVKYVAIDPAGKFVVSSGHEGQIYVWDLATRRVIRKIFPRGRDVDRTTAGLLVPRRIEAIALSPDGRTIAEAAAEGSGTGVLRLWNVEDGEQLRVLAEGLEDLRSVVFTPDGKLVASNARDPGKWGHKITLRDVESGKTVAELSEDRLAATLLAIDRDGKLLASAGARKIHIWDIASRKLLHTISSHKKAIRSICFSPNGKMLVSASADDTLHIWDVESGTMQREIEAKQDGVYAVAWSPSGRLIASGGADKTIKLWKPSSGKMYARLWGHIGDVLCLAFSADGKTLVSGSGDSTIALWDVKEPEAEEEAEDQGGESDTWEWDRGHKPVEKP